LRHGLEKLRLGYRKAIHDRCKNLLILRRSAINPRNVPAAGEAVNDGHIASKGVPVG
jgi:hypothetical protein